MTPKMRKFAERLAEGMSGAEAARQAGYSPADAKSRASKLRRLPEVRLAVERLQAGDDPFDATSYADPLEFLRAIWTGEIVTSTRTQLSAAVAALPYVHSKAGAGGKKETQRDAAKRAASGRFAPGKAPIIPFPDRGA